jgi:hypothetical protein
MSVPPRRTVVEEFDISGLSCPACGFTRGQIVQFPKAGSWFKSGKAKCGHCGCEFAIQILDDEPKANGRK